MHQDCPTALGGGGGGEDTPIKYYNLYNSNHWLYSHTICHINEYSKLPTLSSVNDVALRSAFLVSREYRWKPSTQKRVKDTNFTFASSTTNSIGYRATDSIATDV
jgi:hypothetical protein